MVQHNRKALLLALLLVIKVGIWTWLLYTIGAEQIVAYVGAENGYIIMFLVALLGGLSTFTSVTYFATVFTLAAAGLNPLGLALASSAGVSIGDVIFYYIGYFGLREVAAGRLSGFIATSSMWIQKKPKALVVIFVYMYAAFTPLPNDILAVMLGTTRQPLRWVLPALVLGNATLIFILVSFENLLPWGG
jgi:membrane protein YqaA with SNARE-associated domain